MREEEGARAYDVPIAPPRPAMRFRKTPQNTAARAYSVTPRGRVALFHRPCSLFPGLLLFNIRPFQTSFAHNMTPRVQKEQFEKGKKDARRDVADEAREYRGSLGRPCGRAGRAHA